MFVLIKGCKDARYDKCQPMIWTLIKKNSGRLPDIPSWSRTFHVGSVPIVSKSIASSNSPKSSFPLTIVNTEFPYVVKTKTSPLPSKAQKKLPVVSSCVSCRGPAYVSVKLLQKKQSSLFLIESHFSCSVHPKCIVWWTWWPLWSVLPLRPVPPPRLRNRCIYCYHLQFQCWKNHNVENLENMLKNTKSWK